MERNIQARPIRTSYQKKLEKFTSSLGKAISKGETIPFADNDLSFTLNLQNERIKEKGLDVEYEIARRNPEDKIFYDTAEWKDEHYASSVGFGLFKIKRLISKNLCCILLLWRSEVRLLPFKEGLGRICGETRDKTDKTWEEKEKDTGRKHPDTPDKTSWHVIHNYFQGLKINNQALKIYFHALKINNQGLRIIL